MSISFLFPIFRWITKKNIYYIILPIGFSIFALTSNIGIKDLLVDTIMPLSAISLFAIGYFYKEEDKRCAICAMPLLIFLLQVKNSGMFFVILYLLYKIIGNFKFYLKSKDNRRSFFLLDIVLPFFSFLIWHTHVKMVFPVGETSKHAMSIENYKEIFGQKTTSDIIDILHNMIDTIFNFYNVEFILMILISAFLIISLLIKIKDKKQVKKTIRVLFANWLIFLIYIALVFAMYVFSMPEAEAETLGSLDRYLMTCLIFIYGISVIFFLKNFESEKIKEKVIAVLLCIALSIIPFIDIKNSSIRYKSNIKDLFVKEKNFEDTERGKFIKMIKDNNIKQGKSYLIYSKKNDYGYIYYLSRYEFWSNNVITITDLNKKEKALNQNVDYLIIWTSDETSDKFLKENSMEDLCGKEGVVINFHK